MPSWKDGLIIDFVEHVCGPSGEQDLAGLDTVDVLDREAKMAEMIVESLTAEFDADKYQDDHRIQVVDLFGRKAAGEEFELPAIEAEKPKIVNMMAALEASVEAAKAAGDGTRRRARRRTRPPRSRPSEPRSRAPAKTA